MIHHIESQTRLTRNQYKIVFAGAVADALNFYDFFLIGFVLAFVLVSWRLSYAQSAIILTASSVGAVPGSLIWGRVADRIGRRAVLIATILNFSLASGIMALVPGARSWPLLAVCQFIFGFGFAGLHTVVIPLVQEFMPASRRGWAGGMVVCGVPIAAMLGAAAGTLLGPLGWRGLCLVGAMPVLAILLIRAWTPESPRWLIAQGRMEEARRSIAWALGVEPQRIELDGPMPETQRAAAWSELFRYRLSLVLSCAIQFSYNITSQGFVLWSTTLLVLVLPTTPAHASFLMIFVSLAGFFGRFLWSPLSDALGRRLCGAVACFGGTVALAAAGRFHSDTLGSVSLFWLLLVAHRFFSDGGQTIVQPYSAEVWPMRLRASGMGIAYAFGSIGRVAGILGLGIIAGSANLLKPQASSPAVEPALYFTAAWLAVCGLIFTFLAIETKGRSIEQIDSSLRLPSATVQAASASDMQDS